MEEKVVFEELTWKNVRGTFLQKNPHLAEIIDKISPSDEFTFIRLRFAYGAKILNNGDIQFPLKNQNCVKLDHPAVPPVLRKKLSYSPIPIGLISNDKTIEVFTESQNRCASLCVLPSGCVFGVLETYDKPAATYVTRLWNMTAGNRTIAFLPRISDSNQHKRLMTEFGLRTPAPVSLFDQWHTFRELAQHPVISKEWSCEIIYFTHAWFSHKKTDPKWQTLYHFFIDTAWQQSSNWRKKMYFEIVWESFSVAILNRNLKPTQNQTNYVKHLIDIGNGIFPGLQIKTNDDCAPIRLLQQIYTDVYLLKNYAPLIIGAHIRQPNDTSPIYSALLMPTQLDYAANTKKAAHSSLSNLRTIIAINQIMRKKLEHEEKPIFSVVKTLSFKYFHSDVQEYDNNILHPKLLSSYDPILNKQLKYYTHLTLPEKSSLFRGCVLINAQPVYGRIKQRVSTAETTTETAEAI